MTGSNDCSETKYPCWQDLSRALLVGQTQNYLIKVWWALSYFCYEGGVMESVHPSSSVINTSCTCTVNPRYFCLLWRQTVSEKQMSNKNSSVKCTPVQQFPPQQNDSLISSMSHVGLLLIGYTLKSTLVFFSFFFFLQCFIWAGQICRVKQKCPALPKKGNKSCLFI